MPLSTSTQQRLLFVILCLVWGTTWLALKVGAMNVPPAFFSGTRWLVAGMVLLLWRSARGHSVRVSMRVIGRLIVVSLLMVAMNQALMLYSLRYVGSGLASVINSALTPIGLLGFGIAVGQEAFSLRQGLGILLGVAGIALLFGPAAAAGELDLSELLGALGVLAGCLVYCAGSVLARPLMRTMPPAHVAAMTNVIGGGTLLVCSLALEPGVGAALTGNWGAPAWLAWWYMLIPGSLGASIIYFMLVRDWGASRAGTYAFISPIIAVILGLLVYGERLHVADAAGMALMLAAAALVLGSKNTSRPPAESPASPRPRLALKPAQAGSACSE